jgi:capsular polysaccharide biosynthesis protein
VRYFIFSLSDPIGHYNPLHFLPMTGPESPNEPADLHDYAEVIRRQRGVVALFALLGLVMGVLYLQFRTPQYTAAAAVLVKPPASDAAPGATSVSMPTESGLVTSADVTRKAAATLHWSGTLGSLSKHVSVGNPADSLLLEIAFTASTRTLAADGANAFAAGYIANRANGAKKRTEATVEKITIQIRRIDDRLDQIATQIAALPPGSHEIQSLTTEQITLELRKFSYESQRITIGTPEVAQLVTPAVPPSSQSGLGKGVVVAWGLLAGGLVGVIVAFARDHRPNTVQTTWALARGLGAPILALVPPAPALERLRARLRLSKRSPAPYRNAALAVIKSGSLEDPRGVMVAPSHGVPLRVAGLFAMAMCEMFARTGRRAVLLAGRRAGLEGGEFRPRADQRRQAPVTDLVAKWNVLSRGGTDGKVPAGSTPNGQKRSGRSGVDVPSAVLSRLQRAATIVLCEQLRPGTDAEMVATRAVPNVLLVVDARTVQDADLVDTRWALRQSGQHLVGVVLVNADPRDLDATAELSEGATAELSEGVEPLGLPAPVPVPAPAPRRAEEPARQPKSEEDVVQESLPEGTKRRPTTRAARPRRP